MDEKTYRQVFIPIMGLGAFCGMLCTLTVMVDYPGGIALGFRGFVCAVLALTFVVLLAFDLRGIWNQGGSKK